MTGGWLSTVSETDLLTKLANVGTATGAGAGAGDLARRCTSALVGLRSQLQQCLDSPSCPVLYSPTCNKEMRILVAADTNVAIDKVLSYLDADVDFSSKGYRVVRLGPEEKVLGYSVVLTLHMMTHLYNRGQCMRGHFATLSPALCMIACMRVGTCEGIQASSRLGNQGNVW